MLTTFRKSADCQTQPPSSGRRAYSRLSAVLLALAVFYMIGGSNVSVTAQTRDHRGARPQGEIVASPSAVTVTATTASEPLVLPFTVTVSVDDVTGINISSFQFNIIYNPLVIAPTGDSSNNFGCTSGARAAAAGIGVTCNVQTIDATHSRVLVAAFGTGTLTGAGSILNIQFAPIPTATGGSSSPLTFENLFMFNNLGIVNTTPANGLITLFAPTAGGASVGGMVMTGAGQAVGGARVVLTDSFGSTRSSLSNPFGFFQFDDVPTGTTYVVNVTAKGHTFQPITVGVNESLTGLNLVVDQ